MYSVSGLSPGAMEYMEYMEYMEHSADCSRVSMHRLRQSTGDCSEFVRAGIDAVAGLLVYT